jgi:excisionase family DNA binding protein
MKTQIDTYPRLMSIHQAVAYSNESRATLYKERKIGNINFVKMGGSTRVERTELDRYIDAQMKQAA